MGQSPVSRLPPSRYFPPAEAAGPEGLVAVGGQLTAAWLLDSYRHGVFPWPMNNLLAWWSPDPRAVLEFDDLHVSRRLARTLRSGRLTGPGPGGDSAGRAFHITCDRDFAGVLRGCAAAQRRGSGTWLTPQLRAAYERLHHLGSAHSIEVWCDDALVGGTYGVALEGMFAAESMFYRVRDASKVALVALVRHLRARGYLLLDIQQLTPHTARLGAHEIPRVEYLWRLAAALKKPVAFGQSLEG